MRTRRKSAAETKRESVAAAAAVTAAPPWEKVLYKRLPYPDDYFDATQFLADLRSNVSVVRYTLAQSIVGACALMAQVDVIVLYLLTFEYVQRKRLNDAQLLAIVLAFALICAVVYVIGHWRALTAEQALDHLRTLVTLCLFGYGFTPIIRTLTTSISTDTIYAVSFLLFAASLVFHDYGLDAPIVSASFSFNLSLAASVFLISRVDSDWIAFYLLALSLCAFCFWPRLRNLITTSHRRFSLVLLVGLSPLALALLDAAISRALAALYVLLHTFIVAVCPCLLMRMQRYKNTIHGPWDEVTLRSPMLK